MSKRSNGRLASATNDAWNPDECPPFHIPVVNGDDYSSPIIGRVDLSRCEPIAERVVADELSFESRTLVRTPGGQDLIAVDRLDRARYGAFEDILCKQAHYYAIRVSPQYAEEFRKAALAEETTTPRVRRPPPGEPIWGDLPGKQGEAWSLAREAMRGNKAGSFAIFGRDRSVRSEPEFFKRSEMIGERLLRSNSGEFTFLSLHKIGRGRYFECRITVSDNIVDMPHPDVFTFRPCPLHVSVGVIQEVTTERAASWFMVHPDLAPKDLLPLVAKYDLTDGTPECPPAAWPPKALARLLAAVRPELVTAPRPSGNGRPAAANGRVIEAPADRPELGTPPEDWAIRPPRHGVVWYWPFDPEEDDLEEEPEKVRLDLATATLVEHWEETEDLGDPNPENRKHGITSTDRYLTHNGKWVDHMTGWVLDDEDGRLKPFDTWAELPLCDVTGEDVLKAISFTREEAPADRPELVTAMPSGNGMAATNGRAPETPAELPEDATSETLHPGPSVELHGPDAEVIVWGERKPPLTPNQYRVVEALVNAHASGERLTKTQLELRTKDAKGNECDPLGVLRRLRKDLVWNQAISMAGTAGRGYSLNPRPHTPAHKNAYKRVENHSRPHTGG